MHYMPPESIQCISETAERGLFAILHNPGMFILGKATIFPSFIDINLDYQNMEWILSESCSRALITALQGFHRKHFTYPANGANPANIDHVPFSSSGEPSPPAVHGQRGMGKAYRLGLVKQDDGGMPIVEYIVKYKTVSKKTLSSYSVKTPGFSFSLDRINRIYRKANFC